MNAAPTSTSRGPGGRWGAALVLAVAFAALVWPVILIAGDEGTSEAADQRIYHLPVIRGMARQWPQVDLVHYRSTTAPGYHLVLALAQRYLRADLRYLQLISSLAGLGLVLATWAHAARVHCAGGAVMLALPLLLSTYVLGGSIWLTTDNAGLWFAVLALGTAALRRPTPARIVAASAFALLAVWTRQVHVWVVAPIAVGVLALSPLHSLVPRGLRPHDTPPRAWLPALSLALAAAAPVVLLAWLAWLWGGLVPPAYADFHAAGANLANVSVILALLGALGAWFGPLLCRTWRDAVPLDAPALLGVLAALALAALAATSYDKPDGRWGGWLWLLARHAPVVLDRSPALLALAGAGGLVLVRAAQRCREAGRGRECAMLLLSLLGWALAQTMNSQAWQRYSEPVVLIGVCWLTALGLADTPPRPRWRWAGPIALASIQLGLCMLTVYRPVLG